jgi:hypothetical protein
MDCGRMAHCEHCGAKVTRLSRPQSGQFAVQPQLEALPARMQRPWIPAPDWRAVIP